MPDDAKKRQEIEQKYQKSRKLFSEVPELTAEQLQQRRTEGDLIIVDVRNPDERAVSMIPGAITTEQFEADREAYQGRSVVTYCTIGHRSGLFAQQLHSQGSRQTAKRKGSLTTDFPGTIR